MTRWYGMKSNSKQKSIDEKDPMFNAETRELGGKESETKTNFNHRVGQESTWIKVEREEHVSQHT
jgi:hypothetical protein